MARNAEGLWSVDYKWELKRVIMVGNSSSTVIEVGGRLLYDPFYAHHLLPKYLLTLSIPFIKLFQWSNTNSSTQAPKKYDY
jgi:hypothetical protein